MKDIFRQQDHYESSELSAGGKRRFKRLETIVPDKSLVKTKVKFDKNGELYVVPTWLYLKEEDVESIKEQQELFAINYLNNLTK